MSGVDVAGIVRKCIGRRFGVDPQTICDATTAADVPGWDSLAYAELLMAIERALGSTLPLHALLHVADVGELVGKIEERL